MKTLCTLLLSFVFVSVTNAQFTPGQTLLTGQVSFNENNNNPYALIPNGFQKSSNLYTSFAISRFKNPLLLSGFGVGFSHQYQHYNDGVTPFDQIYRLNTLQVFYTRSKLKSLAKNFYLSINGNAGVNYSNFTYNSNNGQSETKGNTYGGEISGGLGVMYRIDKHFLVSMHLTNLLDLSYTGGNSTYFNPTNSFKNTNHRFSFQTGFTSFSLSNIEVGFSYLIK